MESLNTFVISQSLASPLEQTLYKLHIIGACQETGLTFGRVWSERNGEKA